MTTVVLPHHARRRWRSGVNDVIGLDGRCTQGLAQMVIEAKMDFFSIGQIGGDVAIRDGRLAVLHVLRVYEGDAIHQIEVFE
ncbi:MAG: hypothetical protein ACI8W7_001228 [Gammaproteobacteria bacterium]|jgi:hypothetical protein